MQERGYALGPSGFVVLRAGEDFEMEVAIFLPTFMEERIAKSGDVVYGARAAFVGADIEPDTRAVLGQFGAGDGFENGAMVPPDGGREDGEFAEDVGILHAEVDGEQAAEKSRRDLYWRGLGRSIAGFDEWLKFFDEQAAVFIGFATAEFAIARGSVFVDALFAGVVDADDDQGLDDALGDEGVGGFSDAPVDAGDERGGGIEEILAVFEIENGKLQVGTFFVDAGEVDDQVALFCEEARGEFFVFAELAGAGGG